MLYDFVLEFCGHWPKHSEGWVKAQMLAALADLRHLQGFLAGVGEEAENCAGEEAVISALAGDIALELQAAADRLEAGL